MMPTVRFPLDDGTVREVEMTDEQVARLRAGEWVWWESPEDPDVAVEADGTIVVRADARPPMR